MFDDLLQPRSQTLVIEMERRPALGEPLALVLPVVGSGAGSAVHEEHERPGPLVVVMEACATGGVELGHSV